MNAPQSMIGEVLQEKTLDRCQQNFCERAQDKIPELIQSLREALPQDGAAVVLQGHGEKSSKISLCTKEPEFLKRLAVDVANVKLLD